MRLGIIGLSIVFCEDAEVGRTNIAVTINVARDSCHDFSYDSDFSGAMCIGEIYEGVGAVPRQDGTYESVVDLDLESTVKQLFWNGDSAEANSSLRTSHVEAYLCQ